MDSTRAVPLRRRREPERPDQRAAGGVASKEGLDQIKAAGFEGLRFDVESTEVPNTHIYTSELPHAQCPIPDAQYPEPDAQRIAQCPMPNAQCPMPNAQCPIPNAQHPGRGGACGGAGARVRRGKRAGLLVMVTTSHTAPYAAAPP